MTILRTVCTGVYLALGSELHRIGLIVAQWGLHTSLGTTPPLADKRTFHGSEGVSRKSRAGVVFQLRWGVSQMHETSSKRTHLNSYV